MSDAPGPGEGGPQTQLPAPPPPSAPPPTPQAPPPPLPPTAAERGGLRALLMSVGGLVLVLLPMVALAIIGIALLVTGMVKAIRARRQSRRILTRTPGAIAAIVIAVLGLYLGLSRVVFEVVAAKELRGYEKCTASALTVEDKQTCQDTYIPQIERKFHLPKGSLDRYRSMM